MDIHVTSQIFIALGTAFNQRDSSSFGKARPTLKFFLWCKSVFSRSLVSIYNYICDGFKIFSEFYCFTVDIP